MTPPTAGYPRSVTPGIETQPESSEIPPPGVYVGLDWIRCTGPEDLIDELSRWLNDLCSGNGKETGRAKFFKKGLRWEPGVMLSWDHPSRICQVDFQGQRLRLLSGHSRIDLLRHLDDLAMKPTRLDGALDFIGQDLGICDAAEASCRAGELCLLRKYSPNNEYNASGVPTRLLLKLGARDSPVCSRIYDKGLEQKIAPQGDWERIEVEWKKERARQAAYQLLKPDDTWHVRLTSLILGAADFRQQTGRSELSRRPRAKWWLELLTLANAVQLAPALPDQSFERWLTWFRTSVAPRLLQFAKMSQTRRSDVLERLVEYTEARDANDAVTQGFLAWMSLPSRPKATQL